MLQDRRCSEPGFVPALATHWPFVFARVCSVIKSKMKQNMNRGCQRELRLCVTDVLSWTSRPRSCLHHYRNFGKAFSTLVFINISYSFTTSYFVNSPSIINIVITHLSQRLIVTKWDLLAFRRTPLRYVKSKTFPRGHPFSEG